MIRYCLSKLSELCCTLEYQYLKKNRLIFRSISRSGCRIQSGVFTVKRSTIEVTWQGITYSSIHTLSSSVKRHASNSICMATLSCVATRATRNSSLSASLVSCPVRSTRGRSCKCRDSWLREAAKDASSTRSTTLKAAAHLPERSGRKKKIIAGQILLLNSLCNGYSLEHGLNENLKVAQ